MTDLMAEAHITFLKDLERELHDLCQPLTTLQCRLELAEMCGEASLMEAIRGGLGETARLFGGIRLIRERLQREMARCKDDGTIEE